MSVATENSTVEPWYKQFWPWFIFSLPAVVVVAGIATVILAVRTPLSMVDDDYYKSGLGINQDIAAWEHAELLGLDAEMYFTTAGVRVDLNKPYSGELEMLLIHPTDSSRDMALKLYQVGERRFEGQFEQPPKVDNYHLSNTRYRIRLKGLANNQPWIIHSQVYQTAETSTATEMSSETQQ